jgi:hypothetical protein
MVDTVLIVFAIVPGTFTVYVVENEDFFFKVDNESSIFGLTKDISE